MATPVGAGDVADAGDVDLTGKRRWGRGAHWYDMTYYTFDEFVAFLGEMNVTRPGPDGQWSVHAAALELWKSSKEELCETSMMEEHAKNIQSLAPASLDAFSADGAFFMLQLVHGGTIQLPGHVGFCLQHAKSGHVDAWGTVSLSSIVHIEVQKQPWSSWQARLRSHTGGCLRVAGGGASLDFNGEEGDEATLFELLPRDGPVPMITIAPKGGAVLGTFVPRAPPPELLRVSGFCNLEAPSGFIQGRLKKAAAEALAEDPSLRGRKRHKQDAGLGYYTFEDFLLYVQKRYTLDVPASISMTRAMWMYACVSKLEDETWDVIAPDDVDVPMEA